MTRLLLLVAFLLLLGAPAAADDEADVEALCERFSGFDVDGDGVVEIDVLEPIARAGGEGRLVLVLVERRLFDPLAGAPDLGALLSRMADDLAGDGFHADVVSVALGPSELHQDGRYVLALREWLRAVAKGHDLAGAVLVGRFPDAFLVRTCSWRKTGAVTLRKGQPDQTKYASVPYLRRVPEGIAHRADIVLSDLDGRWENIYVQGRTRVESVQAVYPDGIPRHGGPCADFERGTREFEDFFHVSDGELVIGEQLDAEGQPAGWTVGIFDESGDHECSAADADRPNVIARPDIFVSRIDARGTALRPKASIVGVDGKHLLDEHGTPQAVTFGSKDDVPHWRDGIWEPDPVFERRLLAEFLERNHAYRTGTSNVAWRPSSIACGLGSGFSRVRRAASDWDEIDPAAADVHGNPTLAELVGWLAYPAVLRTLRAHSDPWGCVFGKCPTAELAECVPGPAWSWTPKNDRLVPSLSAACRGGKLDWFLLRTLYENGTVAKAPAFYLHTGCHGISPPGAKVRPYDHASYGVRQGAEALLFFGSGLALVGRSKVFYDEPRGFPEALGEGRTFGEAWARYFEVESNGESWSKVGGNIGRKRAYFWSVLGDATLRLSAGAPTSR